MYTVIDLLPLKDINRTCFDDAIITILSSQSRDYQLMYLDGMNFSYISRLNETKQSIGSRITVKYNNLALLETYHGVKSNVVHMQFEEAVHSIQQKLDLGTPVIIPLDSYWCPWDINYGLEHYLHHTIIVGFDCERHVFICTDPYFMKKNIEIPLINVSKGYKGYIVYLTMSEQSIAFSNKQLHDTLASHLRTLVIYDEMRKMAEDIKDGLDFELETKNCKGIHDSDLFVHLGSMVNGRINVSHAADLIYKQTGNQMIAELSSQLKQIAKEWEKIRGVITKFYLVHRLNGAGLNTVYERIVRMVEEEMKAISFYLSVCRL